MQMNITLGLRALALLAFVAASTAVIVLPELLGQADPAHARTFNAVLALGHF